MQNTSVLSRSDYTLDVRRLGAPLTRRLTVLNDTESSFNLSLFDIINTWLIAVFSLWNAKIFNVACAFHWIWRSLVVSFARVAVTH